MIWGNLSIICLFGFCEVFFALIHAGSVNPSSFLDKDKTYSYENIKGFTYEISYEDFYKSYLIKTPKSLIKVFKLL